MKLSVIIPAYNAENTISRCLDSILDSIKQSIYHGKENVEIICVDDGSRDATWSVLEQYVKAHDIIRIFHKENGGVGSARNYGLLQASGDYISWIDSDDYVSDSWYPLIHETLLAQRPDCLFFDYFYTADGVDSFVCVSITGGATFTGVPAGTYVDAITGNKITSNGTLTIPATSKGDMRVYVLDNGSGIKGAIGEAGTYLK